MKCPTCGAWSEIKETKTKDNGTVYRRRKCGNNHLFSTYELVDRRDNPRREASIKRATLRTKE